MGKRSDIALTAGKRILIVVVILAALMVGIIEYAENAREPLRLGLQDYLTQVADGNPAEITELEKSELFPQIEFATRDIVIRDKDDKAKALATIERADISMGFWGTFFGMPDYREFKIENAQFATGFVLPQKLVLNYTGVSDPDPQESPPYFIAEGRYNERDLLITAEMRRKGAGAKAHYDFEGEFPVSFKLGGTEATARFIRGLTNVEFAQFVLVSDNRRAVLRTTDVSFDPLDIGFIGDMAEHPFSARLSGGKEGAVVLAVTPQSDDPQFLAELTGLLDGIAADLGAAQSGGQFKVEIAPPVVAQQENQKIKE